MNKSTIAPGGLLITMVLIGCGGPAPEPETAAPAAAPEALAEPAGPSLDAILAGDQRSAANRARDAYRHPKETLEFFGLTPETVVVEIWPFDGWYTEIIAPYVNERGKYYAAGFDPDSPQEFIQQGIKRFREKLDARPDLYSGVEMTTLSPPDKVEIAPPGSADMVLTFRNIHNWMGRGGAEVAFQAMYAALKPGGILGVVEHRGNPAVPQDPKAASGYVNEDYAIRLAEQAGFELVAKSEINANPADTKDYEKGVWTLPPTFREGDTDRDRYAAIGESDRFTLKFRKPENAAAGVGEGEPPPE